MDRTESKNICLQGYAYFVFIDSQSASYILSRQKQLRPSLIELLETDVFSVLPEALPAEVQVVLSDEAVAVGAGAAETQVPSFFRR